MAMNPDAHRVDLNLAGHRAVVTGGSRGIGRATCLALAAHGAAVGVHYSTRQAQAAEVVEEIRRGGGRAVAIQGDLREADAPGRVIAEAVAALGAIDILVNNAGEMTDVAVEVMSDEIWEATISLHLTATFRCTRAVIPTMKAHRWGRIVNISTQALYTGSKNHAHYAAAKAGLLGFTFSLAKEVGEHGITANLVAPGRIRTDLLLERSTGREAEWMGQTPLRRFGEPEEIASAIVFLASPAAGYITGATLHVNGGLVMD
jgi:NAD(P)-dependent dehydrogenase (short-subunit alcohol dehydrogenase family)